MSKFIADLHLHSPYARATSRYLNFDSLTQWAKMKGLGLLSSADFTHPVWWEETKKKLKESDKEGFYIYGGGSRSASSAGRESTDPAQRGNYGATLAEGAERGAIYFVLGSEISCIYSQGGRVRRIHCLLYFPKIGDVDKFNERLGRIGNLRADGRPIIGISAKRLLEMALEVNEKAIFIPAHVWTPWFSLYGSNSGFDSIDECFGDLSKYIYAIETGLSSDPAMNWRISELDKRSIVSFSDAHSAPKMSREVTVFDTDFNYQGVLNALKKQKIAMTIEFFPEEGKYHFTGHRNCNVRHSPSETAKVGIICPNCKKKLTVGVMHRVEQLADKKRPEGFISKNRPGYKNLVPLQEILAESIGQQTSSVKVTEEYKKLVTHFGSEMAILLKTPLEDLEREASVYRTVEGIRKVREGDITIEPGFDGVFGTVKIWPKISSSNLISEKPKEPVKQAKGQTGLFE